MHHGAPPAGSAARDPVHARGVLRSFEPANSATKPVRPSPLTTFNGVPLELLDLLRSFPLFLTAPDAFLIAITNHLHLKAYKPRDYIITEGDEAKSMFWLIRGAVAVTSRDGESTYAELRTGAFFGEIGVLMNIPRTASIMSRTHCVVAHLTKEALMLELPNFPEVERAIREEAEERLALLRKKKRESPPSVASVAGVKRRSEENERDDRKRKNSEDYDNKSGNVVVVPGGQWVSNSVLGNGLVNIRQLLMELPLFASLPQEILHFLGLSARPKTYPPFTRIIQQGTKGGEIHFIVRGEVEVVDETDPKHVSVKARLGKGKFFGEVTALCLAPKTTATVRSVSQTECLVIGGDALAELWKRCPKEVQQEVEKIAKERLTDVEMADADSRPDANDPPLLDPLRLQNAPPQLTISRADAVLPPTPPNDPNVVEPFDPDPLFRIDLENMRARSRRSSLAPPIPTSTPPSPTDEKKTPLTSPANLKHASTPPEPVGFKRARLRTRASSLPSGYFSDELLVGIFKHLPLHELMRLRRVCSHWKRVLTTSPALGKVLNLRPYNRVINDAAIIAIARFIGTRCEYVDLSNCFHITDAGFVFFAQNCSANVRTWRMKSVWDITGQAILEMSTRAKRLERVDLSNCRKVSDQLMQRIVGWVVDYPMFHTPNFNPHAGRGGGGENGVQQHNPSRYIPGQPQIMMPPPGTVIGCPQLKHITLSYCKHVTDRTMIHLAQHASKRLEHIDLTRCTTITDNGFHSWSIYHFEKLKSLCLADCTYLTDGAIVYLTSAAKNLEVLDLVSDPPLPKGN